MRVASYLIICSKNPKTFLKNNSLPSPSPCVNPGKIHFNSYCFFFQHRAGYCLWLLAKKAADRIIAARLWREKRLYVPEMRLAWPLKQDVVRSSPLVCLPAEERGSGALGAAGLTHTCGKAALLTQPLMAARPCKTGSEKKIQPGMQPSFQCHLCVC